MCKFDVYNETIDTDKSDIFLPTEYFDKYYLCPL